MNPRHWIAALLALCLTVELSSGLQEQADAPRREPWSPEVVRLFATLPVQDGGRVKPFDTVAQFRMLAMNGRRKVLTPAEETIGPVEWLMDCLFYPDVARHYECIRVVDSAILTSIGLEFEGKKRSDRYSYEELVPGRQRLMAAAGPLFEKESGERSRSEQQIVSLAHNLTTFESLLSGLDFTRHGFRVAGSKRLKQLFHGHEVVSYAEILDHAAELREMIGSLQGANPEQASEQEQAHERALFELFGELEAFASHGRRGFAFFAPSRSVEEEQEWMTARDVAFHALDDPESVGRQVEMLMRFEALAGAQDRGRFTEIAHELNAGLVSLAEVRGEYGKIPLEVRYYGADFFTRALVFFLISFLFVAFSWMAPAKRWLTRAAIGTSLVGLILVVAGVTLRCIIRSRPPVSTLYETILFTAGCAVLVALAIEFINRERIALALAPVLGAFGMFLSMKYELKEAVTAGDTMPSLVAVLDTNFWLATHVTTVTLGYAAGLLAAAIAHVYLIGKLFGLRRGDRGFYRKTARMAYGVLCFGLFFSIVGTILGGVWANYSWGRFWGWDPKENGALLIVLWELMILHARMGGYVRDFGLCMLCLLGGLVVAFSWWGVNLLGVGLHSYGFTSGVMQILAVFYLVEAGIALAAGVWWFLRGRSKPEIVPTASSQLTAPAAGGDA